MDAAQPDTCDCNIHCTVLHACGVLPSMLSSSRRRTATQVRRAGGSRHAHIHRPRWVREHNALQQRVLSLVVPLRSDSVAWHSVKCSRCGCLRPRRGRAVLAERQQRVRARLVQWQTRVLTGSPPTHSCLLAYCCRCAAAAEERCSRLLQWLRWLRKGACLFAPARKRAKAENHRAHSQ